MLMIVLHQLYTIWASISSLLFNNPLPLKLLSLFIGDIELIMMGNVKIKSIIQQTAYVILLIIVYSASLFITLYSVALKFRDEHHNRNAKNRNEIQIYDLVEKPIPSITRYRKYLILLLRRLNVEYVITIIDTDIYEQTKKYYEEIRGGGK